MTRILGHGSDGNRDALSPFLASSKVTVWAARRSLLERRHRHACQRARDFQLETRYLLSMFKRAPQTLMMALVSGPVGVL